MTMTGRAAREQTAVEITGERPRAAIKTSCADVRIPNIWSKSRLVSTTRAHACQCRGARLRGYFT
jgi:hypothetical protein